MIAEMTDSKMNQMNNLVPILIYGNGTLQPEIN